MSIEQSSKEMPGDDDPLYLRGSLPYLADLCIPHHPLDGIILCVSVAAMNLNGLDGGPHRELRAEQLGHCRFLAEGALMLGKPRSMIHQMLSGLDLSCHVGQLELDALEIRN